MEVFLHLFLLRVCLLINFVFFFKKLCIFVFLDGKPTKVINLALGLVAILGHYNEIVIFDPYALEIHCICVAHSNWVRSVCLSTRGDLNSMILLLLLLFSLLIIYI